MLGTEEHLKQNLLSADAIRVDGENYHLKMLKRKKRSQKLRIFLV